MVLSSTTDHVRKDRICIKAATFEIIRDTTKSVKEPENQDPLLGYIGLDEDNTKSVETLMDLCSKDEVENVVIVYNDFSFSLGDASFAKDDANPTSATSLRIYAFSAKDVHLEREIA
jgi:hypothetical protein